MVEVCCAENHFAEGCQVLYHSNIADLYLVKCVHITWNECPDKVLYFCIGPIRQLDSFWCQCDVKSWKLLENVYECLKRSEALRIILQNESKENHCVSVQTWVSFITRNLGFIL